MLVHTDKREGNTVKETILRLYKIDLLVGNNSIYKKEVEALRKNIMKRMRAGNKMSKNCDGRWKSELVTSMRKEQGQLAISTDCLLWL